LPESPFHSSPQRKGSCREGGESAAAGAAAIRPEPTRLATTIKLVVKKVRNSAAVVARWAADLRVELAMLLAVLATVLSAMDMRPPPVVEGSVQEPSARGAFGLGFPCRPRA
jgi:hypothetical protein